MRADGGQAPVGQGPAMLDLDGFNAWVRPSLPVMVRLAGRLVAPSDRDDVVQDALERAWRRRSTFRSDRGTPEGWLLAIVKDQARRQRSRARPPALPIENAPDAVALDPDPQVDLSEAIAALPERQRLAVNLYYFVDLDIAVCAEVMGCAQGTVKASLHKARTRLGELLALEEESHG